jgi:hypothetical protein
MNDELTPFEKRYYNEVGRPTKLKCELENYTTNYNRNGYDYDEDLSKAMAKRSFLPPRQ